MRSDSAKTNFEKRFEAEASWFGWFSLVVIVAGVVLALSGVIYWSTAIHAFLGAGLALGVGTLIAAIDSIDLIVDSGDGDTSQKGADE